MAIQVRILKCSLDYKTSENVCRLTFTFPGYFFRIYYPCVSYLIIKPPHKKTNNMHGQKQRCTFVFGTWIEQKFQASSLLLWLYSLVYITSGQKARLLVFSCEGLIFIYFVCLLCSGLTSQSTIFQSPPDKATTCWILSSIMTR